MIILETERTILSEMSKDDFNDLCELMKDEKAMYAYEHAFTDSEINEWINKQIKRYKDDGFGLWIVRDKNTGEFIGQVGLTKQNTNNGVEVEVGYLLKRKKWHMGYATETAAACLDYGFNKLNLNKIVCIIRDINIASQNVAKRLNMVKEDEFVKHYYNIDMPHFVYAKHK